MVRILERELSGRLTGNSPDTQVVNTARGNVVGGKWRKPDIVLLAIHKFISKPTPELPLTGFELKIANNFDVTSIYQAHAYTSFLHHAYVVVHFPNNDSWPSALADVRGHSSPHRGMGSRFSINLASNVRFGRDRRTLDSGCCKLQFKDQRRSARRGIA